MAKRNSKKVVLGNALSLATITAGPLLLSGPTNVEQVLPTVVEAKGPTKADLAREVFLAQFAMEPRPARKDMITKVMQVAGLTKAGAATYLQNYKKANGLTAPKVVTQ